MAHIRGIDRSERHLLPESLEDYVGPENPVRAIDAFVEGLDLGALGIHVKAPGTRGSDGYEPGALLKLYIYGYLNRVRSSRALERETHRNLEVVWLTGKLQPDHWTINDFRRKNKGAFKAVLREFNVLCIGVGLFGRELLAIDGSFFKGVNSKARNFTRAKLERLIKRIDKHVEAYFEELEGNGGAKEEVSGGRVEGLGEKIKQLEEKRRGYGHMLAEVEASGGQVSLSDPDARLLKKGGQSTVGYNVQVAIDAENHLVAAADVTQDGNDFNQLAPVAAAGQEALGGGPVKAVADAGYDDIEQIEQCEGRGIEVHVPAREKADDKAHFPLADFRYEEAGDRYLCPQGEPLVRHRNSVVGGIDYAVYYNVAACRGCPVRGECTKGRYRKLKINPRRALMEKVARRVKENPEVYARRKGLAEHPFGTIKYWWGQGAFLTRGIGGVTGEFALSCLAYNFRRCLNILGVAGVLAAARGR